MEGSRQAIARSVRRIGATGTLPCLLLAVYAISMVAVVAAAYRPLSAIDEFQQYDSHIRASQGQIVRPGDRVTQAAMRTAACRGIADSYTPPCGLASYDPNDFPGGGWDIQDQNAPAFYLLNVPIAAALVAARLVRDDFMASRIATSVWLVIGLIALWALCIELGSRRWAAAAVCVIVGSVLNVLFQTATQNPDATALVAGAVLGLLAVRYGRDEAPAWLLIGAAGLFSLLHVHNVVVVGAVAVYLVLVALADSDKRGARLRTTAGVLVGGVVAQGGWLVVRHLLNPHAVVPPVLQQEYVASISGKQLVGQLAYFLSPVQAPYAPPAFRHPALESVTNLQNALFVTGLLGASLFGLRVRLVQRFAVASALAALLGPPTLVILTFLFRHSYVPAFPRYGLSLLPLMAASLAAAVSQKGSILALWALAAAGVIGIVYYSLTTIA